MKFKAFKNCVTFSEIPQITQILAILLIIIQWYAMLNEVSRTPAK